MEFAASAWNPHMLKDINVLEKVQARATKKAHEHKNHEYVKTQTRFFKTKASAR